MTAPPAPGGYRNPDPGSLAGARCRRHRAAADRSVGDFGNASCRRSRARAHDGELVRTGTAPAVERRTLFDGALLQIGHIAVHPVSSGCGDIEVADRNVLALPLAGVFAKHDGPRVQAIATPNHALLIAARKPYRLSFPGSIGDRCLALRLTDAALERVAPEVMTGRGFDEAAHAPLLALPPSLLLARSRYWHDLSRGDVDPLEAEARGIDLLAAVLRASRQPHRPRGTSLAASAPRGNTARRHVTRTLEAIAAHPARRWTLASLAGHVSVSPGHLAHVFRAETGASVYDYVLRARLARALEAVLDSDAGLVTIALDAGFVSHSHFTARFRALFGLTPAALRRGARGALVRQLRSIVTAPARAAA